MIEFIIGAIILLAIVGASMTNKDDLKRFQSLKNKKRFSGKRLSLGEQEEIAKLTTKYWWY